MKPLGVAVVILVGLGGSAASAAERAAPPTFSEEERAVFFDDAFAALEGERPDYSAPAAEQPTAIAPAPATAGAWGDWIAADVVETEIKRQAAAIAEATRSEPAFRAGGWRQTRDAAALLGLMFRVAAEHDEPVRWQAVAPRWSVSFAGAAAEIDSGAPFQRAEALRDALAELVRGARPEPPVTSNGSPAGRGVLMRRMELATGERLPETLVDRRSWRRGAADARHEAQLLAVLAEALLAEGLEDADDESYAAYARQLREAASSLATAAEGEDRAAAATALEACQRSCAACHDDYRG
ncbi:cytochrome c [Pseudobythopirellula maris]|nr:cytochrome c [Pseudobythopirellula maris]